MGGGNSDSSSKEITIDDVVKFIHDNINSSYYLEFPYTKYDDIPDIPNNIEVGAQYVKCTFEELTELYGLPDISISVIFSIGNYNIVLIYKQDPII